MCIFCEPARDNKVSLLYRHHVANAKVSASSNRCSARSARPSYSASSYTAGAKRRDFLPTADLMLSDSEGAAVLS